MDLITCLSEHIVIHNKKNNEISHIDLRISNNYFAYFFIILSSFTASCYSIHIFLLISFFLLLSQKMSPFIGVLTLTWALDTLSLQRNICQNIHTSDISISHKNPSHLTILEGNAQAKPLGLEFQIPQVLCKSAKSVRIKARILVAESFL